LVKRVNGHFPPGANVFCQGVEKKKAGEGKGGFGETGSSRLARKRQGRKKKETTKKNEEQRKLRLAACGVCPAKAKDKECGERGKKKKEVGNDPSAIQGKRDRSWG